MMARGVIYYDRKRVTWEHAWAKSFNVEIKTRRIAKILQHRFEHIALRYALPYLLYYSSN
jgi:hypothetical protein